MKIQGPNPLINAYKSQQQKQVIKKNDTQKDQLNISDAAKKMQMNEKHSVDRAKRIAELKKLVQSGEYKIDYEKTAQKMNSFWSKQ
ncbi:flagellar biosynthesis anti-sigma factor FlgM [Pseudogracilibacillus sp. SE30717A]|uniref:flagellar biosynthesis anti-sigma factor FlgM n=1 Tax=Pseudogracilibacillus sp. SE30717A TaxID=3098293 RepID=UPI00300DD58A